MIAEYIEIGLQYSEMPPPIWCSLERCFLFRFYLHINVDRLSDQLNSFLLAPILNFTFLLLGLTFYLCICGTVSVEYLAIGGRGMQGSKLMPYWLFLEKIFL